MSLLDALGLKKPRKPQPPPASGGGAAAAPPAAQAGTGAKATPAQASELVASLRNQIADAIKQLAPLADAKLKAQLGNQLADIERQHREAQAKGADPGRLAQAVESVRKVVAAGAEALRKAAEERERERARKEIAAFAQRFDQHLQQAAPEVAGQPVAALKQKLDERVKDLRAQRAQVDGLEPVAGAARMKALESQAHQLFVDAGSQRRQAAEAKKLFDQRGEQAVANTERKVNAGSADVKRVYGPRLARIKGWLETSRRQLERGEFDAMTKSVGNLFYQCQALDTAVASYAVEYPKYKALRAKVMDMIQRLESGGLLDVDGLKGVAGLKAAVSAADTLGTERGYAAAQTQLNRVIGDAKTLRDNNNAYRDYTAERDKVAREVEGVRKHAMAKHLGAELKRIDGHLKAADQLARQRDGGALKALTALKSIRSECAEAKTLATKLAAAEKKLPALTQSLEKKGIKPDKVADTARYAIKVLVEEECSDEDAVKMAVDASGYRDDGLDEQDAIMSSRVKKSLQDAGLTEDHAKAIGRNVRAGGTASADDAKALAKAMKGVSKKAIETLNNAGITSECCRGPITDAMPELAGVQPRGWPDTATWDQVPGVYNPSVNKVVVGTMDDGGQRKVPATGEGPLPHGATDLFGHEAGHAFDAADGGGKSRNAPFLAARGNDIAAASMQGSAAGGEDDYFLTQAEGGTNTAGATSETFAESFAMHFSGNSRWPKLEDFWKANPWGV